MVFVVLFVFFLAWPAVISRAGSHYGASDRRLVELDGHSAVIVFKKIEKKIEMEQKNRGHTKWRRLLGLEIKKKTTETKI